MSESKHTRGPWKVRENGVIMKAVEANKSWLVYSCGRDYMGREELEANARLIAAAPDLLEALECLLKADHEDVRSMAITAIAKARGGQS